MENRTDDQPTERHPDTVMIAGASTYEPSGQPSIFDGNERQYLAIARQVAADAAAAGIGHDATDEASTTAVRGMIATRCAAAGIDLMDFTTWLHN